MISAEKIRNYLGIEDDAYDEELLELRDRIQAVIEKKLDWYFGPPRVVKEYIDGSGTNLLILRQPPVDPLEVVIMQSLSLYFGVPTDLVSAADYEVDGRKVYHLTSYWYKGRRNITAEYEEGWDEDTGPGDIQQLLLELMESRVTIGSTATAGDVTSETIGDYSYTIDSDGDIDVEESSLWTSIWGSWKRARI